MAVEVIVSGTPRTGTSFMMSIVERLGLSVGSKENHKPPDEHNRFGYYENEDVMAHEVKMLERLGIRFAEPRSIPIKWKDKVQQEVEAIKGIVTNRDIQAIKATRGWLLADVWEYMFPQAKWIYCTRSTKDTYNSRFGRPVEYNDWARLSSRRDHCFRTAEVGKKALYVAYEDWGTCFGLTLMRIVRHLGVERPEIEEDFKGMRELWRPRERSQ